MKDPGGIDALHKVGRRGHVAGHDRLGVARAVGVDVGDRLLHRGHHLDRQNQIAVLRGPVILGGRYQGGHDLARCFITPQLHPSLVQRLHQGRKAGGGHILMNQQGFNGVAGRGVGGFGIEGDRDRLLQIRLTVYVQLANAIGMAQHRNAGILLHKAHKGIGASGNDQIHIALQI